jgi:hypothetical protein
VQGRLQCQDPATFLVGLIVNIKHRAVNVAALAVRVFSPHSMQVVIYPGKKPRLIVSSSRLLGVKYG